MKIIHLKPCTLGIFLGLLFLCSCATTPEPSIAIPASQLPADVVMNKEASRGGLWFMTIRLESGEELLFAVDTGAACTCFDKSLVPKLGKRLASNKFQMMGDTLESGVYAAPKLYFGSTPLMITGDYVYAFDLKRASSYAGHPVMGILGMDVMEHYCIQLDFTAGKIRFLDPHNLNVVELGKAYPLIFSWKGQSSPNDGIPYIRHSSLMGGKNTLLLIDTGYRWDSKMTCRLFRQRVRQRSGDLPVDGTVSVPESVWDGANYTNLTIGVKSVKGWKPDIIGMRFLARHLVTLDFPNHTMYLKQTNAGPLSDEEGGRTANNRCRQLR